MIRPHIRVFQITITILGSQLASEWLIIINEVKTFT